MTKNEIKAKIIELKAERDRCKIIAEASKLSLNGVYGKLASPYSILYAPRLLIAVTLTGQLAILMLIERAERAGVPTVSANTDGVIFHPRRDLEPALDAVIAAWEADTGFTIERTRYAALYSSSVNTYVAIREDGKVKRKGWISDPWGEGDVREQIKKNPQMTVCSEAVVALARDGTPIERTVRAYADPRAFLTVIKSTNGASWRGHPLGRAIRYYWSLDGDPILTASGGRVAKTEGARPLPELTEELPPDLDYVRYCEEAVRLAVDLAVLR